MEPKCIVNECYEHHDCENEEINEKAYKLANEIEFVLRMRKTFCSCNEENIISIDAGRVLIADFQLVSGCEHFHEQAVKATSYIARSLDNQ